MKTAEDASTSESSFPVCVVCCNDVGVADCVSHLLPCSGERAVRKLTAWQSQYSKNVASSCTVMKKLEESDVMLVCDMCLSVMMEIDSLESRLYQNLEKLWKRRVDVRKDCDNREEGRNENLKPEVRLPECDGNHRKLRRPSRNPKSTSDGKSFDKSCLKQELNHSDEAFSEGDQCRSRSSKLSFKVQIEEAGAVQDDFHLKFLKDNEPETVDKTEASKIHECKKCKQEFRVLSAYKRHMREHGAKLCPICGVLIKGVGAAQVKKHVEFVHMKMAKLECQICHEKFRYSMTLYSHQAKVHNYRPERVMCQCPQCGKWIKTRRALRLHMGDRHGVFEPSTAIFECTYCGKKIMDKTRYARHISMHEGIKPFACNRCDLRSVDFSNIRYHSRRVHGKDIRRVWKDGILTTEIEDLEEKEEVSKDTDLRTEDAPSSSDNASMYNPELPEDVGPSLP
ncbi:unnamed protein product [Notodromas monacha]|uniref:C2H2-type domain-containing protein n=1 Tax=Notodromas monacha TaxID=399045 RepID=A0A7R9GA78_9CRUS|nr:unnamed protein product [Notodromas monacha]CAG0915040.1 unnamed protein product [Notodromas monacha]